MNRKTTHLGFLFVLMLLTSVLQAGNTGEGYFPLRLVKNGNVFPTPISGPISNNTISSGQTICNGATPVTLSGSLPSGGTGTFTYSWLVSTTSATDNFTVASGTNSAQNYSPGALTQTTWYRRYVVSGSYTDTSAAVMITVNSSTVITFEPTLFGACKFSSGSAKINATGTALTYQWQLNTGSGFSNISNNSTYSGATTDSFTVSNALTSMNGHLFRCIVSGTCGSDTTNTFSFSVPDPIVQSITGDTACSNGTGVLVAKANSGSFIRWFNSATGGTQLANGDTLRITNPSSPATYYAEAYTSAIPDTLASSINGTNSNFGTIFNVQPQKDITLNYIKYQPVANGTNVTISIYLKSGTGFGFENDSTAWTLAGRATLASVTSGQLTQIPVQLSYNMQSGQTYGIYIFSTSTLKYANSSVPGTLYSQNSDLKIFTGKGMGNVAFSGTPINSRMFSGVLAYTTLSSNVISCTGDTRLGADLQIRSVPSVSADPANTSVSTGGNTSFSISASGLVTSYQWQVNSGSGFANLTDGGYYSGAATASLSLTAVHDSLTGYTYRCIINGTCNIRDTSAVATLTVITCPSNNTISTAQYICAGSTPSTLTGTVPTGPGSPYTYLWEISTTSASTGFSPASGTNDQQNYSPGVISQTTWFRRKAGSDPCYSNVISITMDTTSVPPITLNSSAGSQFCGTASPTTLSVSGLPSSSPNLFYDSSGVQKSLIMAAATFGGTLSSAIIDTIVFAPAGNLDGCAAYTAGSLNGKIVIMNRGTCAYTVKAQNAQNAGAIAAIVADNTTASTPPIPGGSSSTVTIPVFSVTKDAGLTLQAKINSGVTTVTLNPSSSFSYLWSSTATTSTINVTPATTTTYTVTITKPSTTCSRTATKTITVNSAPTASVGTVSPVLTSATTFTLPYSGTSATTGRYTIQTSSGNPMPGFTAINNAVLPASPIAVTIPASAAGTYTFDLYVKDSVSNCTSDSIPFSLTVTAPLSPIGNNTITGAQTLCATVAAGALTGTVPTGGTGTYTYTWLSSTTSATAGFTPASGTNSDSSYFPGGLTQTTWFRRYVVSSTVSDTSTAIMITINSAPAGQRVTSPIEVNTLPYSGTGNNSSSSCHISVIGNSAPEVWYKVRTDSVCKLTVSTCGPTSNYDTYLRVYAEDSVTMLSSNDDYCGLSSQISSLDVTGRPYVFVVVEGFSNNTGNYSLDISGTLGSRPTITLSTIDSIYSFNTSFTIPYTATTGSPDRYSINAIAPTAMPGFATVNNATLPASPVSVTVPQSTSNLYTFRMILTNTTTGCTSLPVPFNLRVSSVPPITNNTITANQMICSGTQADTLRGSLPGGGDSVYTYTWLSSTTDATSNFSAASGSNTSRNYVTGNLTQSTWFRRVVQSSVLSDTSSAVLITVDDITKPVVITRNIRAYLNASGTASITAAQVDSASTDNCGISSLTLSNSSFTCANIGANTIRLIATDAKGNKDSANATVTVLDTIKPVVTTQNKTIYLNASGTASVTAAQINNGSTDACGIASLSLSQTSFNCSNVGANTVTLTVTDVNNNVKTGTATVTVLDTIKPVVTTQNRTIYLNASGSASVTAAQINNGSTDACGIASLSLSQTSFTCSNVGANTVTLTVTDVNNNVKTGTATVTVLDTIKPVVTTQNRTIYLNASGSASVTAAQINNGSTDACGIASLSLSQTSFTCSNVGANTVTLTVTDVNNNVNTATATVTVLDTIKPVVTTQNRTIYLNAAGTTSITAAQINNGSSDACGIQTLSVSPSSFTCSNVGANTVTLTVTDVNGNIKTGTATVTVLDTIKPTVQTQSGLVLYLNQAGTIPITAGQFNSGSTDNCGISTVTVSPTNITCADLGIKTITLTVTDVNGNVNTGTTTAVVLDPISPVARPKARLTVYLSANGQAVINPALLDSASSDNCTITSRVLSQSVFNCSNIGANNVSFTVQDQSGNSNAANVVVTILDTITPIATVSNQIVYLNATGTGTITAAQVNNNSTDNCGVGSVSISKGTFTCADLGTNTITFTVTDLNSNIKTAPVIVNVFDTVRPVVRTKQNLTLYLSSAGTASITVNDADSSSSDNCSIAGRTLSQSLFNCNNLGNNTVTLTATDATGNVGTKTFTVTVLDTVKPVLTTKPATVYLGSTGTGSLTAAQVTLSATDNCSTPVNSVNNTTFTCSNLGSNTVTVTSTDGSNNQRSLTATVTVLDTIKPTALAQNKTIYLNAAGTASLTAAQVNNGSTDNCTISSISISKTAYTTADLGPNTITFTVTDNSSNSSSTNVIVTVLDTTRPTVVTQNRTIYLNASGIATITAAQVNNGSSDNMGITTLLLNKTQFSCNETGSNLVTLTATDVSNNSSSATAVITVLDTIKPNAVAQNLTIYLDAAGTASITPAQVNNGSADNCSIASLALNKSSFVCSDRGNVGVILTVTDVSGNVKTTSATITVLDTIKPNVVVNNNLNLYLGATGTASITTSQINNGSTDNCSIASTSLSKTSFNGSNLGLNVVTFSVTDAAGNVTTAPVNIYVLDTIKPNLVVQNKTIYLNASGTASISTSDINTGSTDNVGITSLTLSKTSFNCSNTGANSVTVNAVDVSGNIAATNVTVTVLDTIKPVVLAQNIYAYINNLGGVSITPQQVNNGSSDNCSIASMVLSKTSFTCAEKGANSVSLTVADPSGNSRTVNIVVFVVDTIKPTALAQNKTLYLGSSGTASLTAAQVNNGSSDNCSIAGLSISKSNFNSADLGANTITFTVTDNSGNTQSTNVLVTVLDTTRPAAFAHNRVIYLNASGIATITANQVNDGSTDNVGITSLQLSKTQFSCNETGPNVVTLTATDISNNSSTATAVITVIDSIKPNADAKNLVVYLDATGTVSITPEKVNSGSTDNCGIASMALDKSTFTCSNRGANTVVLSVWDISGNLSTATSIVTVVDTLKPNVVVNNNLNLYLDATGSVGLTTGQVNNGSTDNCGITYMSLTKTTFYGNNLGLNLVTFRAMDASGNENSVTLNVNVIDTVRPRIIARNKTLYLNGTGSAILSVSDIDNGSNDNVGITGLQLSKTLFSCTDAGTNLVEFTAVDASQNRSSVIVTVTVLDTMLPVVIAFPTDVVLGHCGSGYVFAPPLATDNCGQVAITQTSGVTPGGKYPIGKTTNTFTFADKSGNTVTRSFTVTILPPYLPDTFPPITVCSSVAPFDLSRGIPNILFSGNGVDMDGKTFDPLLAGPGNFRISFIFTDTMGCPTPGSLIVTVFRAPEKPIIDRMNSDVLMSRQKYDFYQWRRNYEDIPGATSQSYTMYQSGIYSLRVGTNQGCTTESDPIGVGVALGLSTPQKNLLQFNLYPNPTVGYITLEADGINEKNQATIEIFDGTGKLVFSQTMNSFSEGFNLDQLSAGTYFLRLSQGDKAGLKSFVIAR